MANETLARRYAMAVFSLATDRGAVERIGLDLQAMADAIYSDETTSQFFVAPVIDRYAKERAFTNAFAGKVDEIALHTLLLLVRKHRESLLRETIAQYRALQQQARGYEPLTVTSARPLAADELRSTVARLEKVYGKKFDVTQRDSPDLIGGMRITMGDRRIDGTVAGRLEELARTLFAQGRA
jgi:F-type H+-transporting ATPase subunit delta